MAKIEQDNRVLAELDKSRATISKSTRGCFLFMWTWAEGFSWGCQCYCCPRRYRPVSVLHFLHNELYRPHSSFQAAVYIPDKRESRAKCVFHFDLLALDLIDRWGESVQGSMQPIFVCCVRCCRETQEARKWRRAEGERVVGGFAFLVSG